MFHIYYPRPSTLKTFQLKKMDFRVVLQVIKKKRICDPNVQNIILVVSRTNSLFLNHKSSRVLESRCICLAKQANLKLNAKSYH